MEMVPNTFIRFEDTVALRQHGFDMLRQKNQASEENIRKRVRAYIDNPDKRNIWES